MTGHVFRRNHHEIRKFNTINYAMKRTSFFVVSFFLFTFLCSGRIVNHHHGRSKGIWTIEWSPNGKWIAVGGDDSTVRFYNGDTYSLKQIHAVKSMVRAVSWHPNEDLLAIATNDGVILFQVETGKTKTITNLKDGGRGIGWNHNGELLALADGYGVIQLMHKDGRLIRSIPSPDKKSYLSLDWHPTKELMATGGDDIRIFDTTGKKLYQVKHRTEETGVLTIDWHPKGLMFASGDYGHELEAIPTLLQFWTDTGGLIKTMKGSLLEYRNIRWNNSGTRLATASDVLRIWSEEGRLLYTGTPGAELWGLSWSPDGERIITGSYSDGSIKVWTKEAKLIRTLD